MTADTVNCSLRLESICSVDDVEAAISCSAADAVAWTGSTGSLGKVPAVTDFPVIGADSAAVATDGVVRPEYVDVTVNDMLGTAVLAPPDVTMSAARLKVAPGCCRSVLKSGETTGD